VTPPKDRLRSWREEPPKAPDEAATADLLQTLRSEPALSPDALARVERHVREQARARPSRPALLAAFRPAVLAAAGGTLLALFAVVFFAFDRRGSPTRLPSAMQVLPPPSPDNVPSDRSDEHNQQFAEADRGPADSLAAEPAGSRRVAAQPVSRSVNKVANRKAQTSEATAPPASAMAGAPAAAVPMREAASDAQLGATEEPLPSPSRSEGEAGRGVASSSIQVAEELASRGRCLEAIPVFSRIVSASDDSTLIERALFGRARCYIALGRRSDANENLQLYLSRFPAGHFATQARDLLH
jgi:hypothetical protein